MRNWLTAYAHNMTRYLHNSAGHKCARTKIRANVLSAILVPAALSLALFDARPSTAASVAASNATIATSTPASGCGSLSPRFAAQGNDYYDADHYERGDYSDKNFERVEHTRRSDRHSASILDGQWSPISERARLTGEGFRITCLGRGDELRSIKTYFDLEEIERQSALSGLEYLRAYEDRHTVKAPSQDRRVDGIVSLETIELPPRPLWTLAEDGRTLEHIRRFRRDNAADFRQTDQTATLIEVALLARRTLNGGLEINQTTWVNGYQSEDLVWRIKD